jgi:hypothetical protein
MELEACNSHACTRRSIRKVDQATRRLRIEAETQGFREVVKPRGGIHILMLPNFREKLQTTKW